MEAIREAVPAIHDQAVIQAGVTIVERLVEELALLREAIAEHDEHLKDLSKAHPDYPIFSSLPSAGP